MDIIGSDIIKTILEYCNIDQKIALLSVDKYYNSLNTDAYWEYVAQECYGNVFWTRAKQRPSMASRPLQSWKKELLRIEIFQQKVSEFGSPRWKVEDFYIFWEIYDKRFRKKIKDATEIIL